MASDFIPSQFTLYNFDDFQSFILLLGKLRPLSLESVDMRFALRMTAKQLIENYFTQQSSSGRDLESIAQDSIVKDLYSLCQQTSVTDHYGMLSQYTSPNLGLLEPFPSFKTLVASASNVESWNALSSYFAQCLSRLTHHPGVDTRELIYSGKWRAFELIRDLTLLPASRYFKIPCDELLSSSLYNHIPNSIQHQLTRIVTVSKLFPGSTIHPHFGISQNRLRIQIPVQIPSSNCRIFCFDHWRNWRSPEPLVLNDNYIHSVYNTSNETRVVVLVDIYHPMLFL